MPKFNVGDKVIYSDLSPWEVATIVGTQKDITQRFLDKCDYVPVECTPEDFDYILDFNDNLGPTPIQSDGMREYNLENAQLLLGLTDLDI